MSMIEKLIVAVFVIALLRLAFHSLPDVVRVAGAILGGYVFVHWLAQGSWDILALLFSLVALAVILFVAGSMARLGRVRR